MTAADCSSKSQKSNGYVRQFAPQVLEVIEFAGGPAAAELLEAVRVLRRGAVNERVASRKADRERRFRVFVLRQLAYDQLRLPGDWLETVARRIHASPGQLGDGAALLRPVKSCPGSWILAPRRAATMDDVNGVCDKRFGAVRDALARNLDCGEELGASLAVDIDGDLVVDLWGGFRDQARTVPWTEDTITNVWSSTKTVTSLAALMLVDRGELDVDAPVAKYWPEFGARGKQDILVRRLMSHCSGVSGLDQPAVVEDLYDWERATSRMAAQAPWWPPGTASGYHASNYGHLVGEVVRRVSGKTLRQFVAEEIAGPLGADFQIGAAERDWGRIADVVPPPPLPVDLAALDPDSPAVKTLTGPAIAAEVANTPGWRRADIGASNGHGNARSVARVMSVVARGGEAGGVRLLGRETIDLIFREQVNGIDVVLGIPLRWGIGYGLPRPDVIPWVPDEKICFWGGWGGSVIAMDTGRRMTVSYMMNKMGSGISGSSRGNEYGQAIYHAVTR